MNYHSLRLKGSTFGKGVALTFFVVLCSIGIDRSLLAPTFRVNLLAFEKLPFVDTSGNLFSFGIFRFLSGNLIKNAGFEVRHGKIADGWEYQHIYASSIPFSESEDAYTGKVSAKIENNSIGIHAYYQKVAVRRHTDYTAVVRLAWENLGSPPVGLKILGANLSGPVLGKTFQSNSSPDFIPLQVHFNSGDFDGVYFVLGCDESGINGVARFDHPMLYAEKSIQVIDKRASEFLWFFGVYLCFSIVVVLSLVSLYKYGRSSVGLFYYFRNLASRIWLYRRKVLVVILSIVSILNHARYRIVLVLVILVLILLEQFIRFGPFNSYRKKPTGNQVVTIQGDRSVIIDVEAKPSRFYKARVLVHGDLRPPDDGGKALAGIKAQVYQLEMKTEGFVSPKTDDWTELVRIIRTGEKDERIRFILYTEGLQGEIFFRDFAVYESCYLRLGGSGHWESQRFVENGWDFLLYLFVQKKWLVVLAVLLLFVAIPKGPVQANFKRFLIPALVLSIGVLCINKSLLQRHELYIDGGRYWYLNGSGPGGMGEGVLSDSGGYDLYAERIMEEGLATPVPHHGLYSFFLAGLYTVFGHRIDGKPEQAMPGEYEPVKIAQIMLGAITAMVVTLIGAEVFSPLIGILAGYYYLNEPAFSFQELTLLTETFFIFLMVLSVWMIVYGVRKQRPIFYILAGGVVGLTTGLRGEHLSIVPAVLILFFVLYRHRREKALLRPLGNFCIPLILLIALVMGRNTVTLGYPMLDAAVSETLYCNAIGRASWHPGDISVALKREGVAGTVKDQYKFLMKAALEQFLKNPWNLVGTIPDRVQGYLTGQMSGGRIFQLPGRIIPGRGLDFLYVHMLFGAVLCLVLRNYLGLFLAAIFGFNVLMQGIAGPGGCQGLRYVLSFYWIVVLVSISIAYYASLILLPERFIKWRFLGGPDLHREDVQLIMGLKNRVKAFLTRNSSSV